MKITNELWNEILDDFEIVLEYHETPDFVEVIGTNGGDVKKLRYYPDGSRYEK